MELQHSRRQPRPRAIRYRGGVFSGCEPDELPEDLAEELPKELQMVES